jgi:hypothetical protein
MSNFQTAILITCRAILISEARKCQSLKKEEDVQRESKTEENKTIPTPLTTNIWSKITKTTSKKEGVADLKELKIRKK